MTECGVFSLKLCSPGLMAASPSANLAGLKWALLKQPSASLIDISIQEYAPWARITHPRTNRGITDPYYVKVWEGQIQQIQDDCNEEVKALVEMSEDKRGHRHLVRHLSELHVVLRFHIVQPLTCNKLAHS